MFDTLLNKANGDEAPRVDGLIDSIEGLLGSKQVKLKEELKKLVRWF